MSKKDGERMRKKERGKRYERERKGRRRSENTRKKIT